MIYLHPSLYDVSKLEKPSVSQIIKDTGSTVEVSTESLPVGSIVKYTTDGSEPSINSTTYDGAFNVTKNATTVKFKVFNIELGMKPSDTFTKVIYVKASAPNISISSVDGSVTITDTNVADAENPVTLMYRKGTNGAWTTYKSSTKPIANDGEVYYAKAVRNSIDSNEVSYTCSITLVAPVITYSGDTGVGTIKCSTSGSTVYYTVNNTDPKNKTVTDGSDIQFTHGQVVRAIAYKLGKWSSEATSKTVSINLNNPQITITTVDKAAGTGTAKISVADTSGKTVTIEYRLAETDSWTTYPTDGVSISYSQTIYARATKLGKTTSANNYAGDDIRPTEPKVSINGNGVVTFTKNSTGSKLYYTTNGNNPTTSSTEWTSGTITVNHGVTVKAIEYRGTLYSDVASYQCSISLEAVKITNVDKSVSEQKSTVTLSCATSGSQIRYTLDGSTPSASSTLYSAPFEVSHGTVVKAYSLKMGNTTTAVSKTIYVTPIAPGLDVSKGDGTITVTENNTPSSTLQYKIGASGAWTNYNSTSKPKATEGQQVYARSVRNSLTSSETGPVVCSITLASPTIALNVASAAAGTMTATVNNITDGATIYYVVSDSNTETVGTTKVYSSSSKPTVKHGQYIRVVASKCGKTVGPVTSAQASVSPVSPTVTTTLDDKVTITHTNTDTTNISVRYNTAVNGGNPTDPTATTGTVYSTTFTLEEGTVIDAICVRSYNGAVSISTVGSNTVPNVTYSLSKKSEDVSAQTGTFTLTWDDTTKTNEDYTIYYTVDGTTPTTSTSTKSTSKSFDISGVPCHATIKARAASGSTLDDVIFSQTVYITPKKPSISINVSNGKATITSNNGTDLGTLQYSLNNTTWNTYSSPVDVANGSTIYAREVRHSLNSSVESKVCQLKCDTPTITPSNIMGGKTISFACANASDATFYYTLDGTAPTTSSSSGSSVNITTANTYTVKVIAVKANYTNSDVKTSSIVLSQCGAPTITEDNYLSNDHKTGGKNITFTRGTNSTRVMYLTNGTSYSYQDGDKTVVVTSANTYSCKAYCRAEGYADSDVVSKSVSLTAVTAPSITPSDVANGKTITFTKNAGTYMFYSTDGSTYTETSGTSASSTKNTANTYNCKAYATQSGYANSSTTTKSITVAKLAVPTLTVEDIVGGKKLTFTATKDTSNNAVSGITIRYLQHATTNVTSSTGTAVSTGATSNVTTAGSYRYTLIATKAGYVDSDVSTATTFSFTKLNPPTWSGPNDITGGKRLVVTNASADTSKNSVSGITLVYVAVNGTSTSTTGATATLNFTSAVTNVTRTAYCQKSGYETSTTATSNAVTVSKLVAPTPTWSDVSEGKAVTFKNNNAVAVTLSYYVGNSATGTPSTTASVASNGSSSAVSKTGETGTFHAFAKVSAAGYIDSDVCDDVSTTINQVAKPVITPSDVVGGKNVTITCGTNEASIKYLDHATNNATTSSTSYSKALELREAGTHRYTAVASKSGWVSSSVSDAVDVVVKQLAKPTWTGPSAIAGGKKLVVTNSTKDTEGTAVTGITLVYVAVNGTSTSTTGASATLNFTSAVTNVTRTAYCQKSGYATSATATSSAVTVSKLSAPVIDTSWANMANGKYIEFTNPNSVACNLVYYKGKTSNSSASTNYASNPLAASAKARITQTGATGTYYARGYFKLDGYIDSDYSSQVSTEIKQVATPVVSSSNVEGGKNVTITCGTDGATIRYANGTATTSSTAYGTSPVQVRTAGSYSYTAIATKDGMVNSDLSATEEFTLFKLTAPSWTSTVTSYYGGKKASVNNPYTYINGSSAVALPAGVTATVVYGTKPNTTSSSTTKYSSATLEVKYESEMSEYTPTAYCKASGYVTSNSTSLGSAITIVKTTTPTVAYENVAGGKDFTVKNNHGGVVSIWANENVDNPTTQRNTNVAANAKITVEAHRAAFTNTYGSAKACSLGDLYSDVAKTSTVSMSKLATPSAEWEDITNGTSVVFTNTETATATLYTYVGGTNKSAPTTSKGSKAASATVTDEYKTSEFSNYYVSVQSKNATGYADSDVYYIETPKSLQKLTKPTIGASNIVGGKKFSFTKNTSVGTMYYKDASDTAITDKSSCTSTATGNVTSTTEVKTVATKYAGAYTTGATGYLPSDLATGSLTVAKAGKVTLSTSNNSSGGTNLNYSTSYSGATVYYRYYVKGTTAPAYTSTTTLSGTIARVTTANTYVYEAYVVNATGYANQTASDAESKEYTLAVATNPTVTVKNYSLGSDLSSGKYAEFGNYSGDLYYYFGDSTTGTPATKYTNQDVGIKTAGTKYVRVQLKNSPGYADASASAATTITVSQVSLSIADSNESKTAGTETVTATYTSGATVRYNYSDSSAASTTITGSTTAYSSALSSTHGRKFYFRAGLVGNESKSATFTSTIAPENPSVTALISGSVTMSSTNSNSGDSIRYTTNGSNPTSASTAYSTALSLADGVTVKAISSRTVNSVTATSGITTVSVPSITYSDSKTESVANQNCSLTITATGVSGNQYSIYYTTDGNAPTTSSTHTTGGTMTVSLTNVAHGTRVIAKVYDSTNKVFDSQSYDTTVYITPKAPTVSIDGSGNVTVTNNNSNGTLYYWTSASSTKTTTKPATVNHGVTVYAECRRNSLTSSAGSATCSISINAPVISIDANTGVGTITCSTANSTVYYTTNNTDPKSKTTTDGSNIQFTHGQVVRAIAYKMGRWSSEATSVTVSINLNNPTITLSNKNNAAGTANASISVTDTSGKTVVIEYSTDNSTWTEYSSAVSVSHNQTFYARATKLGRTTTASVAVGTQVAPVAPGVSINGDGVVTFTKNSTGSTLRYTTDGSNPTASSTAWSSGTITVDHGTVVKAIETRSGSNSSVASDTCNITLANPTVSLTVLNANAGTMSATVSNITTGATVYYKVDTGSTATVANIGTTNTYNSNSKPSVYHGNYIHVYAVRKGRTSSVGNSAQANVTPNAPTITTYINDTAVVSSAHTDSNVKLYYTTNGTTPTANSTEIAKGGEITSVSEGTVIKAIAIRTNNSLTSSASSVGTGTVPNPTYSITSSNDNVSAQTTTVTVTVTNPSVDKVYYTTNGNTPTTSSTEYSAPIANVAHGTVIKVKGYKSNKLEDETPNKTIYVTPKTPTASFNASTGVITITDTNSASFPCSGFEYKIGTTGAATAVTSGTAIGSVGNVYVRCSRNNMYSGWSDAIDCTMKLSTPTVTWANIPAANGGGKTATFGCSNASGVTYYYTTNGTAPSTSSSSGASKDFKTAGTYTIWVYAAKSGYTSSDVYKATAVTVSKCTKPTVVSTAVIGGYNVTITGASGETIHYANGTAAYNSTTYSSRLEYRTAGTYSITAMATRDGYINSDVSKAAANAGSFTIAKLAAPTVAFSSVVGGKDLRVTVSSTSNAYVYWYNGTSNSTSDKSGFTKYGTAAQTKSTTVTVSNCRTAWTGNQYGRAYLEMEGYISSDIGVSSATTLTKLATPTATWSSTAISGGKRVTLKNTDTSVNATLYWAISTTKGAVPANTRSVAVNANTTSNCDIKEVIATASYINVQARASGYVSSSVGSTTDTRTISKLDSPTISVTDYLNGTTGGKTISISKPANSTKIVYNYNGVPSTESTAAVSSNYTTVSSGTAKAKAIADGYVDSDVAEKAWNVVALKAPTVGSWEDITNGKKVTFTPPKQDTNNTNVSGISMSYNRGSNSNNVVSVTGTAYPNGVTVIGTAYKSGYVSSSVTSASTTIYKLSDPSVSAWSNVANGKSITFTAPTTYINASGAATGLGSVTVTMSYNRGSNSNNVVSVTGTAYPNGVTVIGTASLAGYVSSSKTSSSTNIYKLDKPSATVNTVTNGQTVTFSCTTANSGSVTGLTPTYNVTKSAGTLSNNNTVVTYTSAANAGTATAKAYCSLSGYVNSDSSDEKTLTIGTSSAPTMKETPTANGVSITLEGGEGTKRYTTNNGTSWTNYSSSVNVTGACVFNTQSYNVSGKTNSTGAAVTYYNFTMTVGTGIGTIYYKINGKSDAWYSTTTTKTVAVKNGSTISCYATEAAGYMYSEYTSTSSYDINVDGNKSYSPSGTIKTFNYTITKPANCSGFYCSTDGKTWSAKKTANYTSTTMVDYNSKVYVYYEPATGYDSSKNSTSNYYTFTIGNGTNGSTQTLTYNPITIQTFYYTITKPANCTGFYYSTDGSTWSAKQTANFTSTTKVNYNSNVYVYYDAATGYDSSKNSTTNYHTFTIGAGTTGSTKTLTHDPISKHTYTITINDAGDTTGATISMSTYQISSSAQTVTVTASKTGYTATVTTSGANSSVNGFVVTIPANGTGNVTITATWTIHSRTVTVQKGAHVTKFYTSIDKTNWTERTANTNITGNYNSKVYVYVSGASTGYYAPSYNSTTAYYTYTINDNTTQSVNTENFVSIETYTVKLGLPSNCSKFYYRVGTTGNWSSARTATTDVSAKYGDTIQIYVEASTGYSAVYTSDAPYSHSVPDIGNNGAVATSAFTVPNAATINSYTVSVTKGTHVTKFHTSTDGTNWTERTASVDITGNYNTKIYVYVSSASTGYRVPTYKDAASKNTYTITSAASQSINTENFVAIESYIVNLTVPSNCTGFVYKVNNGSWSDTCTSTVNLTPTYGTVIYMYGIAKNGYDATYSATAPHSYTVPDLGEHEVGSANVTCPGDGASGKEYTLTFANNNGTGGSLGSTKYTVSPSSQTVTITKPTRTGYTLNNAYTVSGNTGTASASGTTLTIAANTYGNITVTAGWTINQYPVRLTIGNGIQSITYSKGGAAAVTITSSLSENWNYNTSISVYATAKNGWTYTTTSSDSPATGSVGTSGYTFSPSGTGKTYNLSVAANGGSGGSTASGYTVSASSQDIEITAPTRTGYVLSSYTVSGNTGTASASTSTGKLTIAANTYGNITVTAGWTIKTFTVEINVPGNCSGFRYKNGSAAWTTTNSTSKVTLQNVTYGTVIQVYGIAKNGYDASYSASTPYSYTVGDGDNGSTKTIDFTGATGKSYTITVTNGTAITYTTSPTAQTKTLSAQKGGYTLESWGTAPAGTSISGNTLTIAADTYGAKTITPTWTPNTYTISVDDNGGSGMATSKTSYTVSTSSQTFTVSTDSSRSGYTPSYATSGASSTISGKTITIPAGGYGSITVTANWTGIEYTITVNNGTNVKYTTSPSSQTVSIGSVSKTGYIFNSWGTAPAGTSLSGNTSAGATLTINANTYGNKTITPTWTVKTFTVGINVPGNCSGFRYKNGADDWTTTDSSSKVTLQNVSYGTVIQVYGIAKTGYDASYSQTSPYSYTVGDGDNGSTKTISFTGATIKTFTVEINVPGNCDSFRYKNGSDAWTTTDSSSKVTLSNVSFRTVIKVYGTAKTGHTASYSEESPYSYTVGNGTTGSTKTINFIGATANSYDLTLTVRTGVSKLHYKVNGATGYTETTTDNTVSVTYGTTVYCYEEVDTTNYKKYTSYTSTAPWSSTMGTSGLTFAPYAMCQTPEIAVSDVAGGKKITFTKKGSGTMNYRSSASDSYATSGNNPKTISTESSGTASAYTTETGVQNSSTATVDWSVSVATAPRITVINIDVEDDMTAGKMVIFTNSDSGKNGTVQYYCGDSSSGTPDTTGTVKNITSAGTFYVAAQVVDVRGKVNSGVNRSCTGKLTSDATSDTTSTTGMITVSEVNLSGSQSGDNAATGAANVTFTSNTTGATIKYNSNTTGAASTSFTSSSTTATSGTAIASSHGTKFYAVAAKAGYASKSCSINVSVAPQQPTSISLSTTNGGVVQATFNKNTNTGGTMSLKYVTDGSNPASSSTATSSTANASVTSFDDAFATTPLRAVMVRSSNGVTATSTEKSNDMSDVIVVGSGTTVIGSGTTIVGYLGGE